MSIITDITIRNIKGYGDPPTVLPIELKTNRINLIFAPNGVGKSSMAAAFRSLTKTSLEVSKENKYHKDETLQSYLSIMLDGMKLEANSTINTISSDLICQVINSATIVHTTQKNMGHFTSVSGYIDIEDIIIESVVPKVQTGYSVNVIRSFFGKNSKILNNLQSDFDAPQFLLGLRSIWSEIEKFGKAKSRVKLIDDILLQINTLSGTKLNVYNQINETWLSNIEADPVYNTIVTFLNSHFIGENSIQQFLRFYQLYRHWNINKGSIKKATARAEYEMRRQEYDTNLALLDTTWKNVRTEENGGQLVVKFPHADEISNGQRDLLTFIVSIIKFKIQLHANRKYLLIIDEVFDYLDDANLIAAQYYLTKFLDITKDNLFLCLLSHLNPFTFRSYVFSDKKLNPQYLIKTIPNATLPMMDFISFRERMKKEGDLGDMEKRTLYNNLSYYLFHYNPQSVDYSKSINTFRIERNINDTWGKTKVLHSVLINELNKYFSDNERYDPYAVAMALRLRVEKIMYEKLPVHLQKGFLDEKMTKNKFDYCNNNEVEVPDVLYIVSAIHNEADHLKYDDVTKRYVEKPMVYKLQNNMIKTILKKLFGWNVLPMDTTIID